MNELFTVKIDQWGNKHWSHNDALVKVEWQHGNISHYKDGKLHNEDGPAYVDHYGNKHWYLEGRPFYNEQEWQTEVAKRNPPTKELTVAQIEGILGFKIKIIA
jgi:hypothetical protein